MDAVQNGKEVLSEKIRAMQFLQTSKPADRMDADLVDVLTDLLLDLDGISPCSPAEYDAGVQSVLERIGQRPADIHRRRSVRKALIAAIIAALLLAAGLVYFTFGSQGDPVQFKWIHYIIEHVLPGNSMDVEAGVTIYNHGVPKQYRSIEDCLQSERFDVLFPASLPSGSHILSIRVIRDLTFDKTRILYVTDASDALSIAVILDCGISSEFREAADRKETINDRLCYMHCDPDWCQCQFSAGNDLYVIEAKQLQDVKQIVQNMKGSIENESIKKRD